MKRGSIKSTKRIVSSYIDLCSPQALTQKTNGKTMLSKHFKLKNVFKPPMANGKWWRIWSRSMSKKDVTSPNEQCASDKLTTTLLISLSIQTTQCRAKMHQVLSHFHHHKHNPIRYDCSQREQSNTTMMKASGCPWLAIKQSSYNCYSLVKTQ